MPSSPAFAEGAVSSHLKRQMGLAGLVALLALGGLYEPWGVILGFLYCVVLSLTGDSFLRGIGMVGGALFAVFTGGLLFDDWALQRSARSHRVRTYLRSVSAAAQHYRADHGQYPTGGNREIAARLFAPASGSGAYLELPSNWIGRGDEIIDVWGSSLEFGVGIERFWVTSAGADRVFGTRDDISITNTETANHAGERAAK